MATETQAPSQTKNIKDEALQMLHTRLTELEPLVQEYSEIKELLAHGENGNGNERSTPQRGPKRQPQRSQSTDSNEVKGRAAEVLKMVRENPGITVADLSEKMQMKHPNYVYRLFKTSLDGRVRKEGNGYVAVEA